MKKNNYFLFLLLILISHPSLLNCIIFGGPITEDTTWSPEYSPYIIVNNVQVLTGVTLTILPGTDIQIYSGLASEGNTSDFYWHDGEAVAKMFWVDGRIIAEGTEQDSIVITRYHDDEPDYRWGSIFFNVGSPESFFKYCKISYSYKNGPVGDVAQGALCCKNGKLKVENCEFYNNYIGIWLENTTGPMLIYKNTFRNDTGFPTNQSARFISLNHTDGFFEHNLLIARNNFNGRGAVISNSYPASKIDYIFNHYENLGHDLEERPIEEGTTNSYGNTAINCNGYTIGGYSYSENDTVYVRKNIMIDCINISSSNFNVIGAGGYHSVIADNYINGPGGILIGGSLSNKVYNNFLINDYVFEGITTSGGPTEIYNNVIIDYTTPLELEAVSNHVHNNVFHNNEYLIYTTDSLMVFENNIVSGNCDLPPHHHEDTIFRNNCLSDDVPDGTDAGGNIFDYPMFADTLNNDFRLLPNSPCIDAGYDTTYTSSFDADYYHRIVDGLNDGNAVIDMGAYEFGSSFIGGIRGYAYKSNSDEPLDIVKLKINGRPPEYSDSLGFFEFKLPEGTYNINCLRFYFDDLQVNGIVVADGEYTEIEIYMDETVKVDDDSVLPDNHWMSLSNYPNPFTTFTTIKFTIENTENNTNVEIYNIKGQKIKTLINKKMKNGKHSIIWCGLDKQNEPVSSGIYLYKIKTENKESVKRMLLLK